MKFLMGKKKVLKKGLILVIIFTWLFSGWPQIWPSMGIPPEVQRLHASTTVELATTSDSWLVPSNVYSVTVETWGAGGGTDAPGNNQRRGGGGGGAYSKATISVTPGTTHSFTIGAGGGTDGTAGGDTYWVDNNSTTLVLAKGGSGNTGTASATGGQATNGTATGSSTVKYSGGDGAASGSTASGGGGGGAGSGGDGNSATNDSGGAAQSEYGGAGGDGVTAAGTGQNGSDYGGGGGGSERSGGTGNAGTTGAGGLIRITYTPNEPPTTSLNSPVDTATGVSATPALEFTGTDSNGDDIVYQVQVDDTSNAFGSVVIDKSSDTDANFENLDTATDTDPFNSGDKVRYTVQSVDELNDNTEYYWRVRGKDPSGSNTWGDWSSVRSFTTEQNYPPTTSLNSPVDTATGISLTPEMEFTGTDGEGEDITYQIQIDNTSDAFGSVVIDKSSDTDANFENLDTATDTDPFNSGDKVRYSVQSADEFSYSTEYFWRVRGKDPSGSNTWGDWSSTRSFTTEDEDTSISGTVYTDKGVATSTAGSLIHLAVNGVSIATTTASTTTGVYEFEGITPPSAGDPVTVFVDDASESGATVTLYNSGDVTGLDIYNDYVNLTHEGLTSITNEDIAHFDSTDNSSIPFSVSAGPTFVLEVDSGHTLLVMSGKTYEPANSLETPNLTIDGTVDAGSNLLSITGSSTPFVINGTFNEQTSTVSYENTTSANITDTTYYNLQTDPLSGTPTYTFLGSSTTTNSFTINDGEVVAPTYFTVGGNWTNSGTFTHNSGTVELNTTATTTVTGSNTFYKFVSTEGGKTIKFAAGSTQTVASGGTLELVGGGCDALITLRSTSDGNQWNIDVEGTTTVTVDYVDVDDSNATGGEITATNSLGGVANNTNWDIDGGDCIVTVNITAADYNNLELYPSDGVIYILGTSSGQSITTTGYMEIGNGTDDGSVTAADHNPSIEVGTDFIISANATFRASASALFSVAQDWSNSGSFIHNSGTVSFVDSVKTSVISGATTFYNFTSTAAGKTLRFTAGVVQTFAGTFTVTGTGGSLVNIESSASGTQWLPYFVSSQGTHESPTVTYASIKDSGGDSGSESVYLDTTSVEGSNVNTSYWIWPSFDEGIDISGTVYTDKGVTASTEGSIINLAIDGVSIATTTASTTTGIYEFEGITQPTAGDPVTVFIDDTSESGSTVTLYDGGNVTGLDIYTDHVNLRHENLGPLTNTDIGHYTTDTPFTVSVGDLSVSSGHKLMVWGGKTFTPGGNVTLSPSSTSSDVGGDLEIESGATLNMSADSLSVGGNYLNGGAFSASAGQTTAFTATASGHTVVDGGSGFRDVVFNGVGGGWLYKDGASSAPDSTTVENGEANFVNSKTGTVTVNGGTLLVDWYLGVHTVDKNNTDSDIETGSGDIAVSENSETPASVIFRHDGANWGIASSTQTTESSLSGINPQPELNGAVRIREYEMTSSATTTYLYNLQVEAQAGYTFYDFYEDHGGEYLTSSLSATGTKTISDNWWRENSGTVNGNKPYSGLNMSPDSGTWYVGLAGDIQFSVDEASVGLGALNEMNVWTATGTTMLMATTSYSGGYIVRAYANNDGRLKLGEEEEYIDRWPHDNSTPAFWTGTCDNDGECGFGHTTDSTTLGSECNEDRFLGATKYAGFATSSVNAVEVSRNCIAVPSGESTNIIYRLSAPRASVPGIYSGTIYYIANVNY